MRLLVSAGGTQEPWDEVRFLGNRSTGRQGCEVARAALDSGAEVTLVAANVHSTLVPGGVSRLEAPTAQDMLRVMLAQQPEADLVVQCAAVADFRPIRVPGKITRHQDEIPTLHLERTPDVLAALIQNRSPQQVIVGFGALTGTVDEVLAAGAAKARSKGADLLAVNQVGAEQGFGSADNTLYFFDREGELLHTANGSKYEVGKELLDLSANLWGRLR